MTAATITRRLENVLSRLDETFQCACTKVDFDMKLDALRAARRAGNRSSRSSILSGLFVMLNSCGIPYEKGREDAYYEALVKGAKLPTFSDVEQSMIRSLYECYEQYPGPEEYIARLVRSLADPRNQNEEDPVRLRILKQFVLVGDSLSGAGYGGRLSVRKYVQEKLGTVPTAEETAAHLDDGVFDVLETCAKPQRRPEGKYGLLKLCDDLATGKFRVEGATKEGLYLFAMAFGMTYSLDETDAITDIERSLFRDYYTNNLMRFITDAYWGKSCEYETDPSGQGINYKNYAEMVYLYYLSQDMTPQEKLRRSSDMIQRIRASQFDPQSPRLTPEGEGRTELFRERFITEEVLTLPEGAFESFLCQHYHCNTYSGESFKNRYGQQIDRPVGVFQMESEQNSALGEYRAILEQIEDEGVELAECNYGLWFTDIQELQDKARQAVGGDEGKKLERFARLLASADSLLVNAIGWAGDLSGEGPKSVTRSTLIAAYYYYYNARHENDGGDRWKSFAELFRSFKRGVDPYLVEAYYQTLDGRNLFDVLVAFSSYAYLNL